jgi:hypothetical protein
MRQSGGGAFVVVGDGNAVHMAKGGRIFRFEQPRILTIERLFNEYRRSSKKVMGRVKST